MNTPYFSSLLAGFNFNQKTENQYLELINQPPADRPNRMCVSVSDIHLTDGSVGYQNLGSETWTAFYYAIKQRCINYAIEEVTFVLDGDIVDMIRTDKWARAGIYPWQRDQTAEFSSIVNALIKEVIDHHQDFFNWLKNLEPQLKADTQVKSLDIQVLLGNHDKELLCNNQALTYFYEKGLGIKLKQISTEKRQALGRMYGDENQFTDPKTAPYLPFYFGDTGFRFFTTHGQWRDRDNSSVVKPENGKPGWSASQGWDIKTWQQLGFSPFLLPCFGDTIAAGVLSTFIYKAKQDFKTLKDEYSVAQNNTRQQADLNSNLEHLNTILDELDLYRPTYAAITRILKETERMRGNKKLDTSKEIRIIEENLYNCILAWLEWPFTYESAPCVYRWLLKAAKVMFVWMKTFNQGLEIQSIAGLMRVMAWFSRYQKVGEPFRELKRFPSFLPEYAHYQFQIHGEGHTHQPLEEEVNIKNNANPHNTTYVNFGTWRDQIVIRKKGSYRRRGVLRALFILDLINNNQRSFDYFVLDVTHWGDNKDTMDTTGKSEPKL